MKALTVWQPWASLIAIGAKPYEFRTWRPPPAIIGQRIAIHAGARPVRASEVRRLVAALRGEGEAVNPCLRPEALQLLESLIAGFDKSPDTLFATPAATLAPLSHVLCTAVVGPPKRGDLVAQEFGFDVDEEDGFNWGWPMLDIEPLTPPMPVRGAQGLWEWRR